MSAKLAADLLIHIQEWIENSGVKTRIPSHIRAGVLLWMQAVEQPVPPGLSRLKEARFVVSSLFNEDNGEELSNEEKGRRKELRLQLVSHRCALEALNSSSRMLEERLFTVDHQIELLLEERAHLLERRQTLGAVADGWVSTTIARAKGEPTEEGT